MNVGPLLAIRLSRRAVGVAALVDEEFTFADGRHLTSRKDRVDAALDRYIRRLIEQVVPARVVVYAPRTTHGVANRLRDAVFAVARSAHVPVQEIEKPRLLEAFGVARPRTAVALREVVGSIWPTGRTGTQVSSLVQEAGAAARRVYLLLFVCQHQVEAGYPLRTGNRGRRNNQEADNNGQRGHILHQRMPGRNRRELCGEEYHGRREKRALARCSDPYVAPASPALLVTRRVRSKHIWRARTTRRRSSKDFSLGLGTSTPFSVVQTGSQARVPAGESYARHGRAGGDHRIRTCGGLAFHGPPARRRARFERRIRFAIVECEGRHTRTVYCSRSPRGRRLKRATTATASRVATQRYFESTFTASSSSVLAASTRAAVG